MKTTNLKFALDSDGQELVLPLSMLMQTIFLGGNKGAGKTSAMKRLYEAAYAAGAQCGAIAPLGRWWSLRIGRDGRGTGLKNVVVFGGKHGDVPVDASSGRVVARAVVSKRLHFVLDVELMRKDDRARFVGDFLEELWLLKKQEDASHPFVLFMDEAQTVAPQKSTSKEVDRMREFAADLCREGRNHGVGMVLGAQRSANVDKDLLALVEMLVVMRTIHHLDRKVYESWVNEKGGQDEDPGAWLNRLRRLEKGQAYLYAPELNVFERVGVLLPDTYDATKTAVLGEKVAKVGRLSKLDVKKLGAELSGLVEEASANDPARLRGQRDAMEADNRRLTEVVQDLRAKLEKQTTPAALKIDKRTLKRVERTAKQLRRELHRFEKAVGGVIGLVGPLSSLEGKLAEAARSLDVHAKLPARSDFQIVASAANPRLREAMQRAVDITNGKIEPTKNDLFAQRYSAKPDTIFREVSEKGLNSLGSFPKAQLKLDEKAFAEQANMANGAPKLIGKMTDMLAALKTRSFTRAQLQTVVGMVPGTGGANNYVRDLIRGGWVIEDSEGVSTTNKGVDAIGSTVYPTDFVSVVRRHALIGKMHDMVRVLQGATFASRHALQQVVGMQPGTGGANNYSRELVRRGLIVEDSSGVRIAPWLLGGT